LLKKIFFRLKNPLHNNDLFFKILSRITYHFAYNTRCQQWSLWRFSPIQINAQYMVHFYAKENIGPMFFKVLLLYGSLWLAWERREDKQVRKCTHSVTILPRSPEFDICEWPRKCPPGDSLCENSQCAEFPTQSLRSVETHLDFYVQCTYIFPIMTKIGICRQILLKTPQYQISWKSVQPFSVVSCVQTGRRSDFIRNSAGVRTSLKCSWVKTSDIGNGMRGCDSMAIDLFGNI
jgi:hypothetical protein